MRSRLRAAAAGPLPVAVAVAVLATVAVLAAGRVGPPQEVVRDRPGRVEPVVSTTLACPPVGGEADTTATLAVLPLPGVPVATGHGASLVVEPLLGTAGSPPSPLIRASRRGAAQLAPVETAEPAGHAVRATGALAPGVVAEQSVRASGPELRGLASAACTAPAAEHWFVGASGEVGRRGRLVLSNAADTPAVVDVTLWDEAGPVVAPAAEEVAVAGRSQRVLPLDAYAPGSQALGVHVDVREGRVAAAVEVREAEGLDAVGITAVPAAVPPARSLVVPGLPGVGERLLRVLAPGESDAIVNVRVLGADGATSPPGLSTVTVPAGSVAEFDVGDAVGPAAAALGLESDVPITASVRVVLAPRRGLADVAYTAATPVLAGPVAALLGRSGATVRTALLLTSATDQPAEVLLTALGVDGSPGARSAVRLPAGETRGVPVAAASSGGADGSRWASVLLEPRGPGAVAAARLVSGSDADGALLDLMPLVTPAVSVRVPEVAVELPTGITPPAAGP